VRGDPVLLRAMGRLAPWFVVAAVVALVGGFVDADYRAWVWLASLVIDVIGTLTVARVEWRVSPSHFAERFALIVIIALGESIRWDRLVEQASGVPLSVEFLERAVSQPGA